MEWVSASFPPTTAHPPMKAERKLPRRGKWKAKGSSWQMPWTELQQEPFSNGVQSKGSVGGWGSQGSRALPRPHSPRGVTPGLGSHIQINSVAALPKTRATEPGAAKLSIRKPSFFMLKCSFQSLFWVETFQCNFGSQFNLLFIDLDSPGMKTSLTHPCPPYTPFPKYPKQNP